MKKFIVCLLTGALALSLGACGSSSDEEEATEVTVSEEATEVTVTEEDGQEMTVEVTEDKDGDVSTEKVDIEVEESSQEEEAEEEADVENAEEETDAEEAAESADVPNEENAVSASGTTPEDPAPLGSWVKTSLYNTQDATYHRVYVRVVKATTQSEDDAYVQSAIEANDGFGEEEDKVDISALEVPEDGELVVLDYEIYVPEDFPAPSYGMPEPKVYFTMSNVGDFGFPSADGSETYVGMGFSQDLIVRDSTETYEPGNTYGERCIYAMVKGYTNYVATYSTYPDGTVSDEAEVDDMYTVYHSVNKE